MSYERTAAVLLRRSSISESIFLGGGAGANARKWRGLRPVGASAAGRDPTACCVETEYLSCFVSGMVVGRATAVVSIVLRFVALHCGAVRRIDDVYRPKGVVKTAYDVNTSCRCCVRSRTYIC